MGRFSTHFELIIEGFKAQTIETKKRDEFWVFWGEKMPFMGGNTLRHKSLKEKSLKNEEMEEEEIDASLRFVHSLFPPLFSFILMVVFSLKTF